LRTTPNASSATTLANNRAGVKSPIAQEEQGGQVQRPLDKAQAIQDHGLHHQTDGEVPLLEVLRNPAFRKKLSLSFSPTDPSMSKKRKYPSTELTTDQRELVARLVSPLKVRGISRSVFRDILADAEITVPKSSLDRWVRDHAAKGR
jgi:hypothetical protein